MRLGFVLQKPRQAFYQAFERELQAAVAAAPGVRASAEIDFTARRRRPATSSSALEAMAARAQAVAMVAPDHPTVTAAVEALRDRGVAGVRAAVGLRRRGARGLCRAQQPQGRADRRLDDGAGGASGRARWRCSSAATAFTGRNCARSASASYFRENAPEFEVLETLVNLETRQITHEATLSLLQRHPDLVGLYVAGGGMEGAITALREEGMAGRLAVVVPEITPESRAALAEGLITMAIATPLPELCRELVALMAAPHPQRRGRGAGADLPAVRHLPAGEHLRRR